MTPDALVHRRIIDTRTNTFSHIPIVLEERVSQNELKHWMIVPMEIIDNTNGYAYSKTTSNIGQIIETRVNTIDNTHGYAKAGIVKRNQSWDDRCR